MYCAGKYVGHGDVKCGRESVDDENEVSMRK